MGYVSNEALVKYVVPQGWSLLFLIYVNDLNQVLRFCEVRHFVDESNLLHSQYSGKET